MEAIQVPWYNTYLHLEKITSIASEDFPLIACEMIGSTYYFLSRVVYAYLAKQRNEPLRYDSDINQLALKLPQNIGYFSPIHRFVFKRIR